MTDKALLTSVKVKIPFNVVMSVHSNRLSLIIFIRILDVWFDEIDLNKEGGGRSVCGYKCPPSQKSVLLII